MRRTRLLLVDDHILFREGMSRLLQENAGSEAQPGFELVAQCSTTREARQALSSGVDLILLDYDLGDETGFTLLSEARQHGYRGRVLMLTAGMSVTQVARALELGAGGIFLKHSPPIELLACIRRVMAGEIWLDAGLRRAQTEPASGRGQQSEFRGGQAGRQAGMLKLTERERAVLRGVFEGLANKEIAARLDVSEGSVKAVLQQLFSKADVRTRAQLVRIALEHVSEFQVGSS